MAHIYHATVVWRRRPEEEFGKGRYSRRHVWRFDAGIELAASASPSVVPKPWSAEDAVDPEEAFVASLSSCHMLTFLDLARRAGFVIESYEDEAEGEMTKNAEGRYWVSRVALRPKIVFSGERQPEASDLDRLHHAAHEHCFIANSVKTEIVIAHP